MLKAYRISECEWWAAQSVDAAIASYLDVTGEEPNREEIEMLDDPELDREFPEHDENENPTGKMTTFRKLLTEMHGPGFLAATEY
jgi:hypothetical protein